MAYWVFFALLATFTAGSNGAKCTRYRNISLDDATTETIKDTLFEGKNNFSLHLLKALYSEQKFNNDSAGIFFSPESVWSTMFITYMGAQKITKHEMKKVLGLGTTDKAILYNVFNDSTHELHNASYKSANKIFIQEGTIFKKCLQELLKNDLASTDFVNNSEKARTMINSYIEEKTENKIKNLLTAEIITNLTRIVVVNAIYFKDYWVKQFSPLRTLPEKFTTPVEEINVNMMKTAGAFLYNHNQELQCTALELPYLRNSSMVILLPFDHINGIDTLVNNLTVAKLRDLIKNMKVRRIKAVKLPVFQMQDTYELSPILERMGMKTLFHPDKIDLTGFNEKKEPLELKVVHQSFIRVDEGGTEASAATAGGFAVAKSSGGIEFVANRPFIFFIRDILQNSILFIGIVQRPTEA